MRPRGVLLALASAALFGTATPLSKALLSDLTPYILAGLLYLGAAAGSAWPALRPGRKPVWRAPGSARRRMVGVVLFGGILGPLLLMLGLQAASAASVSLWLNLELAATAIVGYAFFRDHLTRFGGVGVLAIIAGSAVLSYQAGQAGLLAGALVALACIAWAIDNHLTALIDGIHPSQSTFWKGLIGGATNLSIGLLLGGHLVPQFSIGLALLVGAISYGASIILYIYAAHELGGTRAQGAFATAPIWGLLGAVALGESLRLEHAAAAAAMALGVVLLVRDRHEHRHQHEATAHEHSHRHDDDHHTHEHPGLPASTRHTHWHEHKATEHTHPHWPDLHHRHRH